MRELKIINGYLVNDGTISKQDIHVVDTKIVKIGNRIKSSDNAEVFDAAGKYTVIISDPEKGLKKAVKGLRVTTAKTSISL